LESFDSNWAAAEYKRLLDTLKGRDNASLLADVFQAIEPHLGLLGWDAALFLGRVFEVAGGPNFEAPSMAIKTSGHGYYSRSIVNGIEISVGWDRGYQDYTVYLPQIDLQEFGACDQVIRISRDSAHARQVIEYAVAQAAHASSPIELFKALDQYISEEIWPLRND
jgi:hypothetical protein